MSTAKAPRVFLMDASAGSSALPEAAVHGDMLVDTAADRTLGVRFLMALDDHGRNLGDKRLVRKDETGSGYCSVPAEVTRAFPDPVAYYLPHLEIEVDGTPLVRQGDWYTIELDAARHAELLSRQTGGRPVATGRRVAYFVGDFGAGQGFRLWNPLSAAEDDSMNGWKPLDQDTPGTWLGASVYREAASLTRAQERNRAVCEDRLLASLAGKEGDIVTLAGIPDDVDRFREAGGMMTTGTLTGIRESDAGGLPAVLVRYTEWVEDPKGGDNRPVEHELVLEPTVLSDDGPFGNVHFWVSRDAGLMLYPPAT